MLGQIIGMCLQNIRLWCNMSWRNCNATNGKENVWLGITIYCYDRTKQPHWLYGRNVGIMCSSLYSRIIELCIENGNNAFGDSCEILYNLLTWTIVPESDEVNPNHSFVKTLCWYVYVFLWESDAGSNQCGGVNF